MLFYPHIEYLDGCPLCLLKLFTICLLYTSRWIGIATVCAVCLLSLLNIDRIVAEDHLARNTDQLLSLIHI